ncbi:MAG: 4-(cytidine 5'-diphospho)-2-C-methyl-D-erythritol kinase [Spirochaetaceae bacterium]|nr:MAG: 4-(cytidine 5'-diphospho)-2-C-methyl-D-erythritol kinase [Spirochaetaceae bacterium]
MYIPLHGRSGQLILKAPAKVNLHLDIKGFRPDGYHEILSIVHSVPLFDTVYIRSLKEKNALHVYCDPPLPGGVNIAAAAVQLFRNRCGLEGGIEVRIAKRIPVGAGLGGGSSDAAAVLSGLNEMFAFQLSAPQLHSLAAELGSDVPFFLNGPAALLSGRGEIIRVLAPRSDLVLILVYPGFAISTLEAYGWFDGDEKYYPPKSIEAEDLKLQFEEKAPNSWDFFNAFQSSVERRHPLIKEIVMELVDSGAHLAQLSGSGSSVIGVFTDVQAARSVGKRMRLRYPGVWLLVPLQSGGLAD